MRVPARRRCRPAGGVSRSQAAAVNSERFQLTQRTRLTASACRAAPLKGRPCDLVIVWLWDAGGEIGAACGVSGDYASASEAAGACVASGMAVALVQAAELVDGSDALDAHYARFGSRWQATRTREGAVRWRELAPLPPNLSRHPRLSPAPAEGFQ